MVAVQAPGEGPVVRATRTVLDCLADAGVAAEFGLPTDDRIGALHVWPLALLPERTGTSGPDLLRLRVRFLIVGDGSRETLAALDRALIAAAGAPYLVLLPEPLPAADWTALRLPPSAAAVVEVPVRVPRPAAPVVRVGAPLRLAEAPLVTLRGRVVGPGEVAVPGALVRLPGLDISTRTGGDGSFRLAGVPAIDAIRLEVSGKGLRLSTEVTANSPEPLVLRCQLEEV